MSMKSTSDLFCPGEEMLLENFDVTEQNVASKCFLLQDAKSESHPLTFKSGCFSPAFILSVRKIIFFT